MGNAKEVVDLPNPNVLLNQRTQLKGEVETARRKLANQQSRTAMEKVKHEEMLICFCFRLFGDKYKTLKHKPKQDKILNFLSNKPLEMIREALAQIKLFSDSKSLLRAN